MKDLFSVPEGEKVTEKVFVRILASSLVCIFLNMICLAGTTWAWFAVSIENTGNTIAVAQVSAQVTLTDSGHNAVTKNTDGSYSLSAESYTLQLQLQNEAKQEDDLGRAPNGAYVVITVNQGGEVSCYCVGFAAAETEKTLTLELGQAATVSFSVAWMVPAGAGVVSGAALQLGTP